MEIAARGMDAQMMIAEATKKKVQYEAESHANPLKGRPIDAKRKLIKPKFGSTNHCHTVKEASSGIAQTTIRVEFMKVLAVGEAARIMRAREIAPTMVSPAVHAQNARDFARTDQK